MSGSLLDDEDEITGINVTPLVDVMLVLLVIFMVTASYIVHRSIEVELPQAETGRQMKSRSLAFSLTSEAQLFLDGVKISFDEVGAHIKKARQTHPEKVQALISADVKTPHGQVVKLIDTVRKNGINEFAINVDAAEGDAKPPDSDADSLKP
ncbi:MAG: ExbD/TolR family protein [Oligoflexales bacterium]